MMQLIVDGIEFELFDDDSIMVDGVSITGGTFEQKVKEITDPWRRYVRRVALELGVKVTFTGDAPLGGERLIDALTLRVDDKVKLLEGISGNIVIPAGKIGTVVSHTWGNHQVEFEGDGIKVQVMIAWKGLEKC